MPWFFTFFFHKFFNSRFSISYNTSCSSMNNTNTFSIYHNEPIFHSFNVLLNKNILIKLKSIFNCSHNLFFTCFFIKNSYSCTKICISWFNYYLFVKVWLNSFLNIGFIHTSIKYYSLWHIKSCFLHNFLCNIFIISDYFINVIISSSFSSLN